ncbi:MAG: hypothetical protein SFX73_38550 [Kofleriaceae bacterium]|nr:hypothetical protein [Kofleriaceae bacterium]
MDDPNNTAEIVSAGCADMAGALRGMLENMRAMVADAEHEIDVDPRHVDAHLIILEAVEALRAECEVFVPAYRAAGAALRRALAGEN